MCTIDVHQNLQSNMDITNDWTWSLLEAFGGIGTGP